jgi:hypothetical protein
LSDAQSGLLRKAHAALLVEQLLWDEAEQLIRQAINLIRVCRLTCISPVLYRENQDSSTVRIGKGRKGSKGKKPLVSFPWGCDVKCPGTKGPGGDYPVSN